MKNTNTNEIDSVVTYNDVGAQMKSILKDNRGKSGVYLLINKTNGKRYIGSSTNLSRRLSTYFSIKFLATQKGFSLINNRSASS
jgi:excinuclease UvrABC nuclease subunit